MDLENILSKAFSHIYIEDEVKNDPIALGILSHFPDAVRIPIRHYKDVFTPAGQDLLLQKKIPSLIIARKSGRLIYNGAPVCEDFGNKWFYYTSSIMNCCYDCEYCYLQGMYPSADMVIFTNINDIFAELDSLLADHPVYLCISYDTDLLGLEGITGYVKRWIEYTSRHSNLLVECRTKSAGTDIIEKYIHEGLTIPSNFIFAWTLSPDSISRTFEHGAPTLDMRLTALKKAMSYGLTARICLDPVLLLPGWKKLYSDLIDKTFKTIDPSAIKDVSIGGFRVSRNYLVKMKKRRPLSQLTRFPYINENGTCSYGSANDQEITDYLTKVLSEYISANNIFVWK